MVTPLLSHANTGTEEPSFSTISNPTYCKDLLTSYAFHFTKFFARNSIEVGYFDLPLDYGVLRPCHGSGG
jgi:hypothetical protein